MENFVSDKMSREDMMRLEIAQLRKQKLQIDVVAAQLGFQLAAQELEKLAAELGETYGFNWQTDKIDADGRIERAVAIMEKETK